MRSCSMSCLLIVRIRERRCAASLLSLPFFLACLIWPSAPGLDSRARSVGAQAEAAGPQGLLDLLDRLATEVRDRVQLRLRLADQLADGLNARPLEAVVGANAQL